MSDLYSEIEFKWDGEGIDPKAFLHLATSYGPVSYHLSSCPDIYYVQGKSVVRHRWSGGAGELTTKRRKSATSITDRAEVDLKFSPDHSVKDVTEFLRISGWKRLFTLFKDQCHVFFFEEKDAKVTLAYYGVERLNERTQKCENLRHFVEVEVEKGSKLSDRDAMALLQKWRTRLETTLGLGEPMKKSLFEIYSNRTYATATKDKAHADRKKSNRRSRKRRSV